MFFLSSQSGATAVSDKIRRAREIRSPSPLMACREPFPLNELVQISEKKYFDDTFKSYTYTAGVAILM